MVSLSNVDNFAVQVHFETFGNSVERNRSGLGGHIDMTSLYADINLLTPHITYRGEEGFFFYLKLSYASNLTVLKKNCSLLDKKVPTNSRCP